MPEIEIDSKDRKRVEILMEFLKNELGTMPVNARFVFTVEIVRWLDPEIKELKRKADAMSRPECRTRSN